jgi:maleylacetate reductase
MEERMLKGTHGVSAIERVIYGRSAAEAVAEEAERLDAGRAFVITNKSMSQTSIPGAVAQALGPRCAGIYAGVTAHSPRDCVVEGAREARAAGADLLVAVGGGSVIDAAKVMLIALWQDVGDVAGLDAYRGQRPRAGVNAPSDALQPGASAIRMIAVPTTLSAAEFNPFAGVTDTRRGMKESFAHPLIVPRSIVLDPAATVHTPMDLLLSTGVKAVDHAVERLCSPQANPFVFGTATEALRLLPAGLRRAKADPSDLDARLDLQFGMWLSVGAGSTGVGVGASHGIGHVLGGACGVPHGHTSCVMLPSVLRWNLPVNADRQRRVAEAFGSADEPAADLVEALVRELGMPGRLADVGVGPERFAEVAEKSMHDRAVLNNPRPIAGPEQVMEILALAA